MPERRIEYRLLTDADLSAAAYVRRAALEALDRSQGREPADWQPYPQAGRSHLIRTDPEGSICVEVNGVLVGYVQGFVRGETWFCSQFFVLPDVHDLGLGTELLRRAIDYGRSRGARIISVMSSTSHAAQSLYMRHGMYGIAIAYSLAGPVDALCDLPEPDGVRKRIVDCDGWQDRIAALDELVWGADRRQDHAFYMSPPDVAGRHVETFAVVRDGEMAGYAYADDNGFVAPVAARTAADQLPLLRMAGEWLRDREVGEATTYVLSANPTALGALLDRGWKLRWWTFFLASEPFGRFDRYIPAGGMFL